MLTLSLKDKETDWEYVVWTTFGPRIFYMPELKYAHIRKSMREIREFFVYKVGGGSVSSTIWNQEECTSKALLEKYKCSY